MKRRLLSMLLALVMALTLPAFAAAAEPTYSDTAGHWAESSIERWSGHGIVQGSNGEFDPDGQLTCAQLAAILARLLKLPEAPDAGFSDNSADAWYYDSINRCAAAGILLGNGDGTVTPEGAVSRERAMVMLARVLRIEPIENPDLEKFGDAAAVSDYARGYVAALIEAGIVNGVEADRIGPQLDITRAATVAILDRAIGTYADKDGETVEVGDGLTLIVAKDVKITNAPAGSTILVADGAEGLTVNGKAVSDDQTYVVPEKKPETVVHTHSYDEYNYCAGCGQFKSTVVAAIGQKGYETLVEAVAAAQDGETVKLLKDTTESNIILKSGTLDLGGYTLDAGAVSHWGLRAANGIDVTIKNGTVKNAYSALSIWGSNESSNPTRVTVAEDVTFTESAYGIVFTGYSDKNDFTGKTGYAVLNFNGAITTGDGQCPIFVMGNLGNSSDSATTIGENGNQINIGATARITSEEEGIVLNGMAKLSVVDGAVITGADAITMKRGYLNITGGTFTGTGDKHVPTDAQHSGAEQSGSAITVSSTYNYSGLIDVKISGGTFNSTNSYGFYAGQSVENGNQIKFTNTSFAISGGNFSGGEAAIYFADGKYISGGTFTSDPSAYLAAGYKADESSGVWTVSEDTSKTYCAQVGNGKYETLAVAVAAAGGQTITLLQDTSSERINLEDTDVTIDLNGKTLTSDAAYGVMFCAKNGHKIKIIGTTEGSKLDGTLMITASTDGHIEIEGGTYENARYCPLYINGAVSSENSTLSVKNAVIKAADSTSDQDMGCGIYLAGYSTSTFTDCTITAPVTGIEIRAGKLTLTNCTVTGGSGAITEEANGNGATVKNAALAISQHNTKKTIDVTVSGGTYTASAALYQTDVQNTGSSDVTAKITDGTFRGTVEAKTQNVLSISGGTFTSNPSAYLAAGYKAVTDDNKTWTVRELNWDEYPADGTLMPAGVEIKDTYEGNGENGKTFTITLKDKEAFLYFTQIFDRAKAFEARKTGLENGSIKRFKHEYNLSTLNMWYGPYCSRITVKLACDVDLGGMEIKPFGMNGYVFYFDGGAHTISNAKITATTADSDANVGFFQSRVYVSNVVLDSIHVTAAGCGSAGVVAGSPTPTLPM